LQIITHHCTQNKNQKEIGTIASHDQTILKNTKLSPAIKPKITQNQKPPQTYNPIKSQQNCAIYHTHTLPSIQTTQPSQIHPIDTSSPKPKHWEMQKMISIKVLHQNKHSPR
jgi:hypothetical protein